MPEPLRTQRYEGLFQSQTQEMFEADARTAADNDWYPKSEKWTGGTLFVEYEHDPGRRLRAAAPPIDGPPPSSRHMEYDAPPSGRRRRIVLGAGAGVAIIIVAVVAVTTIGSGVLNRSGGGTQTGGTPGATPAAAAVILASPLGSRTGAVELFRTRGFSGFMSPLVDGRDRWRGTDKRSSVAEVIGPEDRITEVSLAVRLLRDEKRSNKARAADLESLFTSFAPLAAQWATDELDAADSGMARTSEQQFGDVLVRLVSMPVKGGSVVKFQIITQ